jgi:hypothetical protein
MKESFTRTEPDTIASTLGFTVRDLGRGELQYREGNHAVLLDSEGVRGPIRDIVIYQNSLRNWDPPHELEIIDDADRKRILRNVERALGSQGIKIGFI